MTKIVLDRIKRFLILVVFGSLILYTGFLLVTGVTVMESEFASSNDVILIAFLLFFLYKFVFFGVYPVVVKISKPVTFFAGVAFLFLGQYVLKDDPMQVVYLADFSKILGVVMIVLAPTNVLFTSEILSRKKKKTVEVIEV